MIRGGPPIRVLREFGVVDVPRLLQGGQATSWHAGGLVFKPGGGELYEEMAEILVSLNPDDVRLGVPVRSTAGSWVVDGWEATRWVEGREPDEPTTSTWVEVIEAGRALHRVFAPLPKPVCLDARDDWWARGDRAAWGEGPVRFPDELEGTARRLEPALAPLGPSQLVHGDLTRNVLLAPALLPAVIDISPYWRPTEYAEGVVVADALCWHGEGPSLLEAVGVSVAAVARALLFRLAVTAERISGGDSAVDLSDEARRYDAAAIALGL